MKKRDIPLKTSLTALFLSMILCVTSTVPASAAENTAEDVMTATSVCVQGKKAEIPADEVLKAQSVGVESGEIGETAQQHTKVEDRNWWGIPSQAVLKVGETASSVSDRKSVTIDSVIKEGYENQTAPVFQIDTGWKSMNMDTQDLMLYVKLPATGRGSSLRMAGITMGSWEYWPALSGMKYKYLAIDGEKWNAGTTDGNNQLNLPDGFEGYIRLMLNSASNYASKPRVEMQMVAVQFMLGAFGGECGPAVIGGTWFSAKEDRTFISIDDKEPVKMTIDRMSAVSVGLEPAEIGADAQKVKKTEDKNWWGIPSKATVKAGEAATSISDRKSAVIDSVIKEGYENQTAPIFQIDTEWKNMNMDTQDLMLYVKFPATGRVSGMRLVNICMGSWEYWPTLSGMKYKYLPVSGGKWQTGTTDGNNQLEFPDGFEGYVRLVLDSAANYAGKPRPEMSMMEVSFYLGAFGGEYGPAVIGGAWFTSKSDSRFVSVDGGETVELAADKEGTELPVDIGLDECMPWWNAVKRSTVALGEKIAPIGESKSVLIDSPEEEGTHIAKSAQVIRISPKHAIEVGKEDILFYLELPSLQMDQNVLWLKDFYIESENIWGNYKDGKTIEYLAVDGTGWVTVQSDVEGRLSLPDGFKGYIKIHPEQISSWTEFTGAHTLEFFRFHLGGYGGKYGSAKIGGVWIVSKSNSLYASVDGGEKQCLSTYWADNTATLAEYRELVLGLTEKKPEVAAVIDRLTALYSQMSEEYRNQITKAELDKVNEYAEAIRPYRPQFLGVSIRAQGAAMQGMKIGWSLDEAHLKKEGYTVVSGGAVALYEKNYDGSSDIDRDTKEAVLLDAAKSSEGYYYAVLDIKDGNESLPVLMRSYVVLRNNATGEEQIMWCDKYQSQSSQSNTYMKCSLADAAAYFKISLKAK